MHDADAVLTMPSECCPIIYETDCDSHAISSIFDRVPAYKCAIRSQISLARRWPASSITVRRRSQARRALLSTVATAYVLGHRALSALYRIKCRARGSKDRVFRAQDAGVTGVTAAVLTLLTSAAHDGGFRVSAGVSRRDQQFGCELPLQLRFTRLDTKYCGRCGGRHQGSSIRRCPV